MSVCPSVLPAPGDHCFLSLLFPYNVLLINGVRGLQWSAFQKENYPGTEESRSLSTEKRGLEKGEPRLRHTRGIQRRGVKGTWASLGPQRYSPPWCLHPVPQGGFPWGSCLEKRSRAVCLTLRRLGEPCLVCPPWWRGTHTLTGSHLVRPLYLLPESETLKGGQPAALIYCWPPPSSSLLARIGLSPVHESTAED